MGATEFIGQTAEQSSLIEMVLNYLEYEFVCSVKHENLVFHVREMISGQGVDQADYKEVYDTFESLFRINSNGNMNEEFQQILKKYESSEPFRKP